MRLPLILLLALLLAPPALAGNAPGDYADFDALTGWNTQKKMARDADGALWWTYVEPTQDGNTTEVVVVRQRGDERVELPRPRAARGEAGRPSLALDAEGTLHLAWTERAEDDREVFAARWDGRAWADATQLSGGLGYAGFPSVAADAHGGVHLGWYGFDGDFYQAFYRERGADAGAWLPSVQLSSGNLDANNPSVVVDRDGGVHMAWYKSDGQRYRIWHAHKPAEGEWGLPARISGAQEEAFNAALAVDRQGRVHAAWDELHADGFWVRHSVWEGGAWSGPAVLARGDLGGEYPAIAAWGEGVLVAWSVPGTRALVATDLSGEPRPLLGGARGVHPSLRGPSPWPASEDVGLLDLLWTSADGGRPEPRLATLRPGCSPWDPLDACGDASVPPADGRSPVPAAPWPLAALLAVLLARRRA